MCFRDMRLFNQALLAHQAMQLITYPNSLCAQDLKAKYFPQGNVLDMAPASDASPTWRAIEHGVELLKHGIINRIGDGQSTRIWRDNWIPRHPNLKPSGAILTCRLRRVSQLMRSVFNEWDEGTLRRYFYPWDVEEILKIKLSEAKTPDQLAWSYEKSGIFSVHGAYRLALSRATNMDDMGCSSENGGERGAWKRIWMLLVMLKVRNFIWKLIRMAYRQMRIGVIGILHKMLHGRCAFIKVRTAIMQPWYAHMLRD
jgi:hypothetical protein